MYLQVPECYQVENIIATCHYSILILFYFKTYNFFFEWHILINYAVDGYCRFTDTLGMPLTMPNEKYFFDFLLLIIRSRNVTLVTGHISGSTDIPRLQPIGILFYIAYSTAKWPESEPECNTDYTYPWALNNQPYHWRYTLGPMWLYGKWPLFQLPHLALWNRPLVPEKYHTLLSWIACVVYPGWCSTRYDI